LSNVSVYGELEDEQPTHAQLREQVTFMDLLLSLGLIIKDNTHTIDLSLDHVPHPFFVRSCSSVPFQSPETYESDETTITMIIVD